MMTIRVKILQSLAERPKTRGQLVIEIQSRRTTIYDYLEDLVKEGLIEKGDVSDNSPGRPYIAWSLTQKGKEEVMKSE